MINKNNIIWCSSIENDEDLNKKINKNNKKIKKDLVRLLSVENQQLNIDFLNKFFSYFQIDKECLCNILSTNSFLNKKPRFILNDNIIMDKITNINYLLVKSSIFKKPTDSDLEIKNYLDDGYNKFGINNDKFLNGTLINYIINSNINESNYIKILDTFFCTKDNNYIGLNITEYFNNCTSLFFDFFLNKNSIGILDIIDVILEQVIKFLNKLNKYSYTNNYLILKNIQYNIEKDKYYFKIANLDHSKILFNGLQFYEASENYNKNKIRFYLQEEDNYFVIKYDRPFNLDSKSEINDFFSIMYDDIDLNTKIAVYNFIKFLRNDPRNIIKNFDIYTLIVSILIEPALIQILFDKDKFSIFKKTKFYKLTQKLFYKKDWDTLLGKIKIMYIKYNKKLDLLNNEKLEEYLNNNNLIDSLQSYPTIVYLLYGIKIKKNINISNIFGIEKIKEDKLFKYPYKFSKNKKLCITKCKKSKKKLKSFDDSLKKCKTYPIIKYNDDLC